jgi:uncharacterized protein (TIGR02246 family)
MKIRFLFALLGLAISFAVPTFARQTNTPDSQLRQKLLELAKKFEEAWNNNDASALAALFTEDAVLMNDSGPVNGAGREAIEQRYAAHFASGPGKLSLKLVQVYAIGSDTCAISEFSHRFSGGKGYHATIYVREGDDWKIRMAYTTY